MKKSKKHLTTIWQLKYAVECNTSAKMEIDNIEKEFDYLNNINIKPLNKPRENLYKILHSARALELSLKTFLDIYGVLPTLKKDWTLGGYLKALSVGANGCFSRLNGGLKERFQKTLVNKRNQYLHVAGNFPSNKSLEEYLENIDYLLKATTDLIIQKQ